MDMTELSKIMIENGLVIRAIPHEQNHIVDVRRKDQFPDGVVIYMEEFKREMLQFKTKNSQGGKFIVQKVGHQDSMIRWGKGTVFYDTIEEAVQSIVKKD